jgi:hypothetical protein
MINISKLEIGDILLYRAEGGIIGVLIGWFSGGHKMHASIVSNLDNGKVKIIEAHQSAQDDSGNNNKGKVLEKTLNIEKWGDGITTRRVPGGLSIRQKSKLIRGLRKDAVGKVSYDLESFPSMLFYSRVLKIFGLSNLRKNKPILNDPEKQVCSTLISVYYYRILNIDVCQEVNMHSVTPVDLNKTKSLISV